MPTSQEAYVAGLGAGVFGTLLGFPMDRIKTEMQSNQLGFTGTISDIARRQGVRGFYRGVLAPVVAFAFLSAQTFCCYEHFKAKLTSWGVSPAAVASGIACGPLCALITTPFELVKIRVSLGVARSVLDVPVLDLYKGHGVNTLREMLFLGAYFGVYDLAKRDDASAVNVALAGSLAGASGWLVSYPLDCVKTNVQRQASASAWHVLRSLVADKGFFALYRGIGTSIARACLVSACRFSAYETGLAVVEKKAKKSGGR